MATTILKNLKEAKNRKPSAHLHNAINYIMNPEKTEKGLWISSNCGITSQEIYDAMMTTKNEFNKTWEGRVIILLYHLSQVKLMSGHVLM